MPRLIPLFNPLDSFAPAIDAEQQARYEREVAAAQAAERHKRNTMIGVGAGVGLLGGIALAPALGLGGSALAGSTALTGAGAGISSVAATTLTGTGALLGGFGGAGLGATLGSEFAGGDYGGAIVTAANAGTNIVQGYEERQRYGFNPSHEDRQALATQAAKLGLSLGELEQRSQASGVSVPDLLHQATASAMETQQYEALALKADIPMTGGQLRAAVQANPNAIHDIQLRMAKDAGHAESAKHAAILDDTYKRLNETISDSVPDHAALADLQEQFQGLNSDVSLFGSSGGRAGRAPWEVSGEYARIRQGVDTALQGRSVPKPRTVPDLQQDGSVIQRPLEGSWVDQNTGSTHVSSVDEHGNRKVITGPAAKSIVMQKLEKIPDGPLRDAAVDSAKRLGGVKRGEEGNFTLKPDGSVAWIKPVQTPEQTFQTAALLAAGKMVKEGDPPEALSVNYLGVLEAQKVPAFLSSLEKTTAKVGTNTLTQQDFDSAYTQALAKFGPDFMSDPKTANVRNQLKMISDDVQTNEADLASPASALTPPPPGGEVAPPQFDPDPEIAAYQKEIYARKLAREAEKNQTEQSQKDEAARRSRDYQIHQMRIQLGLDKPDEPPPRDFMSNYHGP